MTKTRYEKAIDKLNAERHLHLEKLIQMPFEKLEALKKQYSEIYTDLEEMGYKEAAEVHFMYFLLFDEAITVKHGNDEQAWDYLT